MKSRNTVDEMITGLYVSAKRPHTVVTVKDNSAVPIPNTVTFPYAALQVMYSPKGVTNQFITIEGNDVLSKYDKLFGSGNTNIYGPMGLYARRFLEGGFKLNVLNVAPDDASHANAHVSFVIKQSTRGELKTPEFMSIFVWHDPVNDEYLFSKVKEDLPQDDIEIIEIQIPKVKIGFESRYVEGVHSSYDPEKFLSETDVRLDLPTSADPAELDVNIPIFGIFYEGATEYGNNFTIDIGDTDVLINNRYPLYSALIKDQDAEEFKFNFALFNIRHDMVSMSFRDRASAICRMSFTEKNSLSLFRPYLVSRKLANKAKTLIPAALEMVNNAFLAKVKTAFPGFDENNSDSNIMELLESTTMYNLYYKTQDTEIGRSVETPFSRTTPWTEIDSSNMLIDHAMVSRVIKLQGGSSGKLKEILDESEFDWNIRYNDYDELPIFQDLFIKAYNGTTDPRIFDPAEICDSLLIGDSYPNAIQTVMEDLTRNKPHVIYNDRARVDFTYWRTPSSDINDFNDIYAWIETWAGIKDGHNTNCKPFVGRGYFEDPTTGGQSKFELLYDYFGEYSSLAAWLSSGTRNSFASDSWSKITSVVPGTEELIPTTNEKEVLTAKDVNYFTRKSDRSFGLGEDTAMFKDMMSVLKNTGTSMHFGKIIREVSLIARDNIITDPSKDVLDKIVRKMYAACTIPAKHFGNTLTITPRISTEEMELNKNVVAYDVAVEGIYYSRHNRVIVNANAPSAS